MNTDPVVQRFVEACADDTDVVAAFIGGSHAEGTADAYSDLDLYVITTDQGYERFFARRREFLRRLGRPVLEKDFSDFGFDMLLFILEDGVDGELAFARQSHFTHIHGGAFQLLLDKQGVLRGAEFPRYRPGVDAQRKMLGDLLTSFWRDAWHFGKAMGRGNFWSAQAGLERMRRAVVNLLRLQIDFTQAAEGYYRVEHVLPPEPLRILEETVGPLDPRTMWPAQRILGDMFRRVAPELAKTRGLDYPIELDRLVTARLAGRSGGTRV